MARSKITLITFDGEAFEMEESEAFQSMKIKELMKTIVNRIVPIHKVSGKITRLVVSYCRMHATAKEEEIELRKWDQEFVNVDQETLMDLNFAASYLRIKGLDDLTCKAIIEDDTPGLIRNFLKIDT